MITVSKSSLCVYVWHDTDKMLTPDPLTPYHWCPQSLNLFPQPAKQVYFAVQSIWMFKVTESLGETKSDSKGEPLGRAFKDR